MGHQNKKIFFIISNSRSGSTMVRQLINTHQNIVIPEREYGSLTKILKKSDTYGDLRVKENFNKFYKDFERSTSINLSKSTTDKSGFYELSSDEWYNKADTFKIDELYKILLNFHAEISKKNNLNFEWVGDKSPQHIGNIKILTAFFPNAKFILLTRNPIDIALSQNKFSFRHFKYIPKDKMNLAWKRLTKKDNTLLLKRIESNTLHIVNARKVLNDNNKDYLEVNYEEILRDSGIFFENISRYLNVENKFEIQNFKIKASQSGKEEGAKGLLTNNINKYESLLSPNFIAKINAKFGNELDKAADGKSVETTLKNSQSSSKWHTINNMRNILVTFIPTVGVFKTLKLVHQKFILKKIIAK